MFKIKNNRQVSVNRKLKVGNLLPATLPDEAVTLGQLLTGNFSLGGNFAINKAFAQNHTAIPIATTALATLPTVTSGVVGGLISSTSAAAVTITLDSAANIIAGFAAVGLNIGTGTLITFLVDNSAGANTITLAVDGGATIAVTTPAITGGSTLTVLTANAIAQFGIYFNSATTAKLLRMY